MKNPNPMMLVRIAQGDAYGIATEYIKLPKNKATLDAALRFERYCEHPELPIRAGRYTDDTQMSIAVTEVLLSDLDPRNMSPAVFREAFLRAFKRDPRGGYSRHLQAFLERITSEVQFAAEIQNKSDKNGAAMRSVPIGVLPNPSDVIDLAMTQARITHNTAGGVGSSILVALMSHYALYEDTPFSEFPDWCFEHTTLGPRMWEGGPVTGPDVGFKTADAVFTLLATQATLIDIARTALTWGGDTDSVLALAWGIASARMQEEKLPAFFDNDLEDGPYGYKFLSALGAKLMEKYR